MSDLRRRGTTVVTVDYDDLPIPMSFSDGQDDHMYSKRENPIMSAVVAGVRTSVHCACGWESKVAQFDNTPPPVVVGAGRGPTRITPYALRAARWRLKAWNEHMSDVQGSEVIRESWDNR